LPLQAVGLTEDLRQAGAMDLLGEPFDMPQLLFTSSGKLSMKINREAIFIFTGRELRSVHCFLRRTDLLRKSYNMDIFRTRILESYGNGRKLTSKNPYGQGKIGNWEWSSFS
jgi:hypothetical protein